MEQISKARQQRTGWAIVIVGLVLPIMMIALGVDLEPIVDEILSGF